MTDENKVFDEIKVELKDIHTDLGKKYNELAEQVEVFKQKSAGKEDLTDIKNTIDGNKESIGKMQENLDKVEAKMQRGGGSPASGGSLGNMIVNSKGFEGANKEIQGSWAHTIEAKDISNVSNTQASPNRNVLVQEQVAPFLQPLDQPLSIRGLIPAGQTSSDVIQRAEEQSFTNNAGSVAEGALKPESDIAFERTTVNVEKIAHWIRASSEVLSDAAMLKSYIDQRLQYGLMFKEEQQLLNGNGTSPQLTGILSAGNNVAYDNTLLSSGPNPVVIADGVDDIRVAKQQVDNAFIPATGVVLHPDDWAKIELQRDADGEYLYSAVTSGLAPRLWGMNVAQSYSITPGKFLVGSFQFGAMIWDRWAMRVMASNEDRDNFVNNKVTILAEKRLALEIMRPEAFVYGDLSAPA